MDNKRNGELKCKQASSVIDETLPFENVYDPARQPDTPGNRGGRDRVGRSDHRAQHESEAPVETGKNPRRNQCDGYDCESHQAEGQKKNADHVIPEVTPGSGPG